MSDADEVLVLTVEGGDGRPAATARLGAGDSIWVGACACGRCTVDLVVGRAPWTPFAIEVSAHPAHWSVSNEVDTGVVRCRDLEDPQQQILVGSGRVDTVIPFELAIMDFPDVVGSSRVLVFGPEPLVRPTPAQRHCPGAASTPSLRRDAVYFAVLEELCLPWQTRGQSARLPTSAEVTERLQRRGLSVSRRAVDHHVDYLFDRLGLPSVVQGGGRGRRREALVSTAIRMNLVGSNRRAASGPAA